jgi:NAD+ synthetase
MKICLGQINPTVADFDGNYETIKALAVEENDKGTDIIVFPELAVCGYPCRDLVDFQEFRDKNILSIAKLVAFSTTVDIMLIVGAVGMGKTKPTNSAFVIHKGNVVMKYDKMLLPTYDVFDEWRNFEAGTEATGFMFQKRHIGITICEDVWNNRNQSAQYGDVDPVNELVESGIDLIINLSASPFTVGKNKLRQEMLKNIATDNSVDIVYCNQTGATDSIIFDGNSLVYNKNGTMVANGRSFQTDVVFTDLETPSIVIQISDPLEEVWEALKMGTADYLRKCNFEKVVIGISGGIDSALVAKLAVDALGKNNVSGITMPSAYSSLGSVDDSKLLADALGIKLHRIPIQGIKTSFKLNMDIEGITLSGLADENIQARIRGTILMAFSNQMPKTMVLSTGNKSEVSVGFCTIYGDMAGGLAVISDVPKTMVYDLARWINRDGEIIPWNTIDKPPSAELSPDQKDSDSLPPYDILDAIIHAYIEERKSVNEIFIEMEDKASIELIEKVIRLIDRAEYKRQQAAPNLKITSKDWSGRKLPIARK